MIHQLVWSNIWETCDVTVNTSRVFVESKTAYAVEISFGRKSPLCLTRPAVNITVNKIDIYRVRYHYSRDRITIVGSSWRHQQSIVTSSAERKPSEWDTGMMCEAHRFYSHLWILSRVRNKIMYILSWRTVSALTRVLFWYLFPSLLRNSGNKHQNNTLVSEMEIWKWKWKYEVLRTRIHLEDLSYGI